MNSLTQPAKRNNDIVALIAAALFVNILFFIDEGYYDFRWMKDAGNWFMFLIYFFGVVLGEYLISKTISYTITGFARNIITVIAGLPLGFIIVLGTIDFLGIILKYFI